VLVAVSGFTCKARRHAAASARAPPAASDGMVRLIPDGADASEREGGALPEQAVGLGASLRAGGEREVLPGAVRHTTGA